ncbi:hypothetical protein RB594_009301 [Gaeumannomyces avenae]
MVQGNMSDRTVDQEAGVAPKNRWSTAIHNPKIIVIAFFASFGGFEYGYQQGVLGQSLVMHRFVDNFPSVVSSPSATGWLTSVLQLGGILGSLTSGVLGEVFSRKYTMFMACCWVVLGSYMYCGASFHNPSLLYAGRFFTGVGVGTFSGVGPLYNAELSPPELRGFLVSFYQFATILGIMLSFWIGYGSNNIGGTGEGQSNLSWMLPSIIQGIPAVMLAFGIWWLPFSPRWLASKGRTDEAAKTLAYLRKLPVEDERVQVELKEIQAEVLFERRAFAKNFPQLAEKEKTSVLSREFAQYYQILRNWDSFKRVSTAWLVMFFQQWSGIDAIIYYAANPMLIIGSLVMLATMVIPAIIVATFGHDWVAHANAGWGAVAMIWIYVGAFGATWGPVSWTLVSEIFPLSIRAKGASIGASSNWVNNFAVAFFVPPMFDTWKWGTYIFFAVFLGGGIVWVWLCLPETKGTTLEDMDRVFGSRTGEEDALLLAQARRDVGLDGGDESGNEKEASAGVSELKA